MNARLQLIYFIPFEPAQPCTVFRHISYNTPPNDAHGVTAFFEEVRMAVQKSKKSRSKRDMRRSHHALKGATVSEDPTTGTRHRRHHIAADGYYRGRKVLEIKQPKQEPAETEA